MPRELRPQSFEGRAAQLDVDLPRVSRRRGVGLDVYGPAQYRRETRKVQERFLGREERKRATQEEESRYLRQVDRDWDQFLRTEAKQVRKKKQAQVQMLKRARVVSKRMLGMTVHPQKAGMPSVMILDTREEMEDYLKDDGTDIHDPGVVKILDAIVFPRRKEEGGTAEVELGRVKEKRGAITSTQGMIDYLQESLDAGIDITKDIEHLKKNRLQWKNQGIEALDVTKAFTTAGWGRRYKRVK